MISVVATTDSTNADLLRAAAAGAVEGVWLRAEQQTSGRGRLDRSWSSPPGNLYASTIVRLRPGDPPAPTLALIAGIALEEIASAYAPAATLRLKWPNDIMADDAKLAGILLERQAEAVVIGFGANLASHPDLPDRKATDLAALTGSAPDPAALCLDLADAFARWLARWRGEGLAPIRARWLARAYPPGTPIVTTGVHGKIEGRFDGIEVDGSLRLRRADGNVEIVRAGDVSLL